jgi:hypothetical protein
LEEKIEENFKTGVVEKHPRFGENHLKRDEKHAK